MSDAPVLPPDLVAEILSCLPVKALMRFRCVSKTWNCLMFDPMFIKLHLQKSRKNTYLMFPRHGPETPVLRIEDSIIYADICSVSSLLENPLFMVDNDNCPIIYGDYCVFGVCNGLVGVIGFVQEEDYFFGRGCVEFWVRFWNPATRVMSSQDSPHIRLHPSNYHVRNTFYIGIGYDDGNDTYKVVSVLLDIKSQQKEVRVYTFGSTCWKKTLNCPAFPFTHEFGVSLNGTINWIALLNSNELLPDRKSITSTNDIVIFSYDLKNETYRLLLMPSGFSEDPSELPELGVLKGCLCLSHDHKRTHFVVWLMREFGVENSWTQLLNVSFEHLQILGWSAVPMCLPMCMSENEDVLLLGVDGNTKFILYNRKDNRIDRTEDFNIYRQFCRFFEHVESLVLPY